MGGECLNNGCVPSKALITAAKRAAEAREEKRYGVQLAAPRIEWPGVHAHIHDAIARIAPHDSQERFEEMGCDVYRGHASFIGKRKVQIDDVVLKAPRIVIATGSEPFVPRSKVWTKYPSSPMRRYLIIEKHSITIQWLGIRIQINLHTILHMKLKSWINLIILHILKIILLKM